MVVPATALLLVVIAIVAFLIFHFRNKDKVNRE